MMSIVYLNGEFIPQEKATVSIMDRGFLFGDGVYEVIPVFDGHFFGLDEHMQRFDNSLSAIQMQNPLTHAQWKNVLETLIEKNNLADGTFNCYCQITRGADQTRAHTFPTHLKQTVVAFLTPAKTNTKESLEKGFNAITLDDTRRRDCYIKAITLLPNILQMQEAKSKGAIEAILIRNEEVLECTSSNIFMVKDNVIMTPPLSPFILSGITRGIIIKLAKAHGITVQEKAISKEMLMSADEVWVTGSSKEICPIIQIDNTVINEGHVGPMWHTLFSLYTDYKQASRV
jgi:D-alanine transaminase